MDADWIGNFSDKEWNSLEYRRLIIHLVAQGEEAQRKLTEIMPIYEKQCGYIELLERQMALLQKTLDLVEKIQPLCEKVNGGIKDLANKEPKGESNSVTAESAISALHEAAHEFFKDTPPEAFLNIDRTMDL